ncbi:D-amino acid dehydrogenase [Deefgea salmonis]|uniref:D-amino acid dehydrogenase n=1 Tax=Deefgea salmonis TaxID=2875502 RepID=A0ABS8BGC1_9NEIS|nr:D-amino acid dehydrogenase [Deefgea salmonis]MCB5194677.1 D-amino acid dehydrogenase [Deefgea salmonis]
MRVIILGAGVIGVTTAWFLAQEGHTVTVIERAQAPARETSYANGGQISVCHAEPWANPKAPWKTLQWLGEEDAPLLFRLKLDWHQWRWGLRFLEQCTQAKAKANLQNLVRLGLYSRETLQSVRLATGVAYDQRTEGILHYYTDSAEYESAIPAAALMREVGLDRQVKTAAECLVIEPALAQSRYPIVGGTYTPSDESGDAREFTNQLAERCLAMGVEFRYDCSIEALERVGDDVKAVRVISEENGAERLAADAIVVCLGSYSPIHLRPLGITLDIYPAKGYSATIPVIDPDYAPTVSLTDDGYKLVFSRLGNRLRVAGTAEFNGYNLDLNPIRCKALIERTRQIFPAGMDYQAAEFWTGLRPATPGNLPYIGQTRFPSLWLNTGHGTLGWTECCGSAKAIADLIAGRQPEVDYPFVRGI